MSDPQVSITNNPEQSLSTDSEESFLIKQLNKSQLFHNSGSQADLSDSSGSRKSQILDDKLLNQSKRKSYFTESYVDEHGHNRSFSVFQDVTEANTDDSRDISLSGLSSLNIDNFHSKALGELDTNSPSSPTIIHHHQTHSQTASSSNDKHNRYSGSSLREFHLKNIASNKISRASIPKANSSSSESARSSHYGPTPPTVHVAEFIEPINTQPVLHSPSPLIFQKSPNLNYPLIKTPDFPAPAPPIHDNSSRRSIVSDDIIATARVEEGLKADIYDHYMEDTTMEEQAPETFVLPQKAPYAHTSSSASSSYESAKSLAQSQATRKSILDFESSRKKSIGRPHLLLAQNESRKNLILHDEGMPNVRVSTAYSVGVTPNIDPTPTNSDFPAEAYDDVSIREGREARISRSQEVNLKTVKYKNSHKYVIDGEKTSNANDIQDGLSFSSESSSDNETNKDNHHNDQLLEKIRYYRTQPVQQRAKPPSDTLVWILYLVSFFVPPLFFFLGFGLLDQHIGGKVNTQIKKLSLATGVLVVVLALAMIGVGFGVGVTSAR